MIDRSAKVLLKAADARLMEPEVVEAGSACIVRGRRGDAVPLGTPIAFVAVWDDHVRDDGQVVRASPEVLVLHRGQGWRPVGYRDLMVALKGGSLPETAEDRVKALLGGVYFDTEPATRQHVQPVPS